MLTMTRHGNSSEENGIQLKMYQLYKDKKVHPETKEIPTVSGTIMIERL